ncbi:ankyrin repeat-containing domain protein [Nemania sp. FL0916]|nr:ankyrin repeat-containing domain protein [Nemania sp. FL0916]
MDTGASVDSALIHAAGQKHLEIVRCLLEYVQDKKSVLNAYYRDVLLNVTSTLCSAVFRGHLNIVRYLVEAGADPLLRCSYNGVSQLAIHRTFEARHAHGALDIIRYLISVDRRQLEARTSEGKTCLHLAAEANDAECADWLLSEGADHTAVTSWDETPWQRACKKNSLAVMGVFLKKEIGSLQARHNQRQTGYNSPYVLTWFVPDYTPFYWGGGVS